MLIDFGNIEEKAIPNFKGGELEYNVKMFDDGSSKIMKGRLQPGASIGLHKHEGNQEVIFVIEGIGTVIGDDKEEIVLPGQATFCKEGFSHSLINKEDKDLVFYAVVM